MERVPMTVQGEQMLRKELEQLKNHERPKIVQAISEARALGDLKENAEYHAAREQQSFIEGRIREVEAKLSTARVIDIKHLENDGRVIFGSTVALISTPDQTEVTYKIVGDDEADVKVKKISVHSPLARALIGKYVGDKVDVETPQQIHHYEIIDVSYT